MNKVFIKLIVILFGFMLISPQLLALQWPSPSSNILSGYGYRIHPIKHIPKWHRGIDINTGGIAPIKAVASGDIKGISFDANGGGNIISFGGWKYMHLSNSGNASTFTGPPNWEIDDAYAKNPDDPDIPASYLNAVRYFAIVLGDHKIYYSTVNRIKVGKGANEQLHDANTFINEGDVFAYSGTTGGSTGVHLHLEGDPEISPLKVLYSSNGASPKNSGVPTVSSLGYSAVTGMISALVSTGYEKDINQFSMYINGGLNHDVSFYPRKNAFDGDISDGTKTGFYPVKSSLTSGAQSYWYYYNWEKDGCRQTTTGPFHISLFGTDAGNFTGSAYLNVDEEPPYNYPGCDHPDDNYSVSDTINRPPDEEYTGDPVWITPRVGLFLDGLVRNTKGLLTTAKHRFTFTPTDLSAQNLKDTDLIIIPSGGLHSLWNSDFFKKGLEDYVKAGGNVVVFAQQHGYEYSALPTPDGKPITAYGWTEDQSCQYQSSYIDTYHQVLSSINKATPSINVDGYFTSYPDTSTVLLRRVANGQPAAIMYQYGNGYVIATDFFSDFGYGSGQASAEEIALIRDIITWAKKPTSLPEIKPGETATLQLAITNNSDTDAASVKISVYDSDRKTVVSEQTVTQTIPVGQSAEVPVSYATSSISALGIYHIDYSLVDANGEIIWPRVEMDAVRFVVSNPPSNPYRQSDLNGSISTSVETIFTNDNAVINVTLWNNTDKDEKLRLYQDWSHDVAISLDAVTVPAHSFISKNYTLPILPPWGEGAFRAWIHVFSESGLKFSTNMTMSYELKSRETWPYAGSFGKGFNVKNPLVNVEIKSDKSVYKKTETVGLILNIQNKQSLALTNTSYIKITDPSNSIAYTTSLNTDLSANGTVSQNLSFTFPSSPKMGYYMVSVESFDQSGRKIGGANTSFELPQSSISVTPTLPTAFVTGSNNIPFVLTNSGKIDISSGILDISLKDPDGISVYSVSQPVILAVGESKALNIPVSLPSLKFGDYILAYTQSDETKAGQPTAKIISNTSSIALSLDKPFYKVREIANIAINLINSGSFIIENMTVTTSIPDISFIDSKILNLGQGQALPLQYSIQIPETILGGQHDVSVTLTLPSGSSIVQHGKLTIPESALSITYAGPATITSGDTINLDIANTGGVDTTYATEKLLLTDSKGVVILDGNASGTLLANSKTIFSTQVPTQAISSNANLYTVLRDTTTGKLTYSYNELKINGLDAGLSVRTDKDVYLNAEAVASLSTLVNKSAVNIEDGKIDLKVKKTGEIFSHYLPKQSWSNMNRPYGVAAAVDGAVYVADTGNNRILKFDINGNLITKWGSYGSGNGQLFQPNGIAVSSDGFVYVADTRNHRIQKFDTNGNYIIKWGSYGSAAGQFYYPGGIAVASDGTVYVGDTSNNRIQKFDNNGNFITQWGSYGWENGQFYYPSGIAVGADGSVYVGSGSTIQKFDTNGNFILKWGSYGSGDGQFGGLRGVAVSNDGYVYVIDSGSWNVYHPVHNRIQKFDGDGKFIAKWGATGDGDGQLNYPYGISIAPDGFVYVADSSNNRVQKFDNNGVFVAKWGSWQFYMPQGIAVARDGSIYVSDREKQKIFKFDSNGEFVKTWGSRCIVDSNGDGNPDTPCDGQFNYPEGVAVDTNGYVYVADSYNYRIEKFDSEGNFITKWGRNGSGDGQFYIPQNLAVDTDGFVYVANNNRIQKFDSNGNFIMKWGSSGTANGQFKSISGISIDSNGFLYILEGGWYSRIQKFDSTGNFITKWGSYGSSNGQFQYPEGLTVTEDGTVYVIDRGYNRIQKFDKNGNYVAKWGSSGEGSGQFMTPYDIAAASDGSIYVADTGNHRIQKMNISQNGFETLFSTSFQVTQPANTTQDYTTSIGTLNATGKLYLQATLKNILGQTVATSEYPFYIVSGNTVLSFNTDKKIYKPGETVTIAGEVKNLAAVTASALSLQLSANGQNIYNDTFNIPANGSHSFTFTTIAGAEGKVTLTGSVTQNSSILVEISDQYEVANPQVSMTLTAPDVVGRSPFEMNVEIKNTGKVDISGQWSVAGGQGNAIDNQQITIKAGESKVLQYSQQITANATYIFTLSGDVTQTVTKTVAYGEKAQITVAGGQGSGASAYPEGKVGIPVTITNTGQVDSQLEINFQLSGQVSVLSGQAKTYYLPKGLSVTDTLYYDLSKGSYQLSAVSVQPNATAQTSFTVAKENDVVMTTNVGTYGNTPLIPVNVNLTNNGWNTIEGSVQLSVISPSTGSGRTVVWNGEQTLNPPIPPLQKGGAGGISSLAFNIDPSGIAPGTYNLEAVLYNNSGQQLAVSSQQLEIKGALFQITQLPVYTTFAAGSEGSFTFKIKNAGNQEGEAAFNLKVMDVLDQTKREWLKPGEEKELSFAFQVAEDLEEKDYFAEYMLTDNAPAYGSPITPPNPLFIKEGEQKGVIKFHVAGVNIAVNASLDKQQYMEGETARLTLVVSRGGVTPPVQNLFARVNYAGYEAKQSFTIGQGQAQPLQFDIPLNKITGEKLFFGIYHESGRSIHLNSLYIYKAGDAISIMTDKQVYNPGEMVTATVGALLGAPLDGIMTLTGPGNYSESFAFSGSVTKNIVLPSVMTAGTYNISGQLSVVGGQLYSVSHPIDVNGIQVKVKEATLDKAKYAATDTINLSLTVESNKDMDATLRTWVVDPSGTYTPAGETPVSLNSSEPLLTTGQWPLTTASMGIHRLVYGIYADGQPQGSAPTQLLLSSGSEAFDVGDAVLLGMTADKADYSTITEPVNISFSLYGSTTATIDLYIDGQSVKSETVALSGFTTKTVSLEPAAFSPGTHVIKAVLTAGSLTSVKESSIVYGSNLPDLTINVGAYGNTPAVSGKIQITATVMNMGKTASGATDMAFYDGGPVGAYSNTPLQTMPLPSIAPGESTTVIFDWNIMGKAGRHTIYAVADASKIIAEFNESNNTATVDVEVPELILNVLTTSSAYEANQDVGIAETITNLTAGNTYSDAVLTTIIKDSAGSTITTLTDTIPAIAPGEASYANSWNTESSRPGSYGITAEVGRGEATTPVQGAAAFEILPTVSVYGDMTLSASEVIQGFSLDISYTLTNNGNVDIANGELKVELKGKATGISSTLTTATLDYLAVLASKTASFGIEKVDVEPGEYTVSLVLTAGGKIINITSKDLTVKPPLKVTKGISILPRVLVWTEKPVVSGQGSEVSNEPTTNEKIAVDALARLGAYYKIVYSETEFMESMRSGYYNTYALLDTDKPTTDGFTSEIVEKVNGGDTLVLTGSSNMDDIKVSEVTGTKFTGYLPDGIRTTTIGMPFYEQPVNITLSGKAQKATMTSATAYASGAIADIYPSVIVNSYGKGKGVLVTFDLGKSSDSANDITTYSALFGRIIGNTAPIETRLIPEGVAPVEITVESIGSAFDLRAMEKVDSRMTILDASLSGLIDAISNTVTWYSNIGSSETVKYLYLSGLSQFRGTYSTEAEVYYQSKGEYRLYNKYPLEIELAEGTAELQNSILNAISLINVTKDKQGIRDGIVKSYMTLISSSSATRKDIDRDIHELLKMTEDVKKLEVDTTPVRAKLNELLTILQRRWAVAKQE